jgi:hypothetical protein
MKQTAVTWLLNTIETKNGKEFSSYYSEFIEQAKEMEKEQTKNIAVESYYSYTQYLEQLPKIGGATVEMDFEQWYNETYGGEK